ncbi:D-Ala-D-Ala carboxypeptidase family metallohydrolase, partial [Pseudomonas sp.]
MNLSEHFTLQELIESPTARKAGIDNTPDAPTIANLQRLCQLLEGARELVGAPLLISSGYRCPALNRLIGGADNSAHVQGLAADFTVVGLPPRQVVELIADSSLAFDQVILEFDRWVHVAVSARAPRRQVLTLRKG